MFDMLGKFILKYTDNDLNMLCPCIYVMWWYDMLRCVFMDMGMRMCEYFIAISTKMYYVFCKLRKLILASGIWRKKDWFTVLAWMLEFVTGLVDDTLDTVMR